MNRDQKEVIVICTRNRIDALGETLRSISVQDSKLPIEALIIDSSDPESAELIKNQTVSQDFTCHYHSYTGRPSLARQRTKAIEILLESNQDIVHFVDDDVTLLDNYFSAIRAVFESDKNIIGVAPIIVDEDRAKQRSGLYRFFSFLFLLEHPKIGGVLSSGGESVAQNMDLPKEAEVECFGGCNCYKLDFIQNELPDSRLEGYSLDEDLDWSYRLSKLGKLVVTPKARLIHHEAPINRYDMSRLAKERLIHRYWFVEKNMSSFLRKPYFWWSVVGQGIRTVLSGHPDEKEKRKGIFAAIPIIWRREHALLK